MPTSDSSSRRGARTLSLVTHDVIRHLETGLEESANHVEQMALDMGNLLRAVFPALGIRANAARQGGFLTRMRIAAELAYNELDDNLFAVAPQWKSDTARGWGAFAVALKKDIDVTRRIDLLLPFADDPHFAVREWAWLALRPTAILQTIETIVALLPLTKSPSLKLRRFASEATRPRGVWSSHIPLLKAEPWQAGSLLSALKRDDERYVQDSVGNWVNDAAKSAPEWAAAICLTWRQEGVPPRVLNRAGRWLDRQ